MSKAASQSKRRKSSARPVSSGATPDRAIYGGLIMIGVFAVLLVFLLSGGRWQEATVGYCLLMAVFVNLFAWQAYRGRHLRGWQAAMARLPMRCAGYGRKGGKPLDAARGHADARRMLIASIAVSIVVIVALSLWLIPASRPWGG